MIFDVFFLILIAAYGFKGFNKGGIYASFNFVGYLLAFIIAFRFSGAIVSYFTSYFLSNNYKSDETILFKLMPIFVYLLVFSLVIFLIRLLARTIKSINKTLMLGWLDRLIGAAIFISIALIFGGTFVWLLDQLSFFSENTRKQSKLYPVIVDIGAFVIENIGAVVPFIKDTANNIILFIDKVKP